MSDLISRAVAIEAVRKCVIQDVGDWAMLVDKAEAILALNALPSAEAYFTDGNKIAEWILCSERLPSDSGNYLITVADLRLGHTGEHTVTIADFYAKAKKWNSIVDVTAWMPLPMPYREDGEA